MKKKILISAVVLFAVCAGTLALLFYTGVLFFNHPSSEKYPIRGVDVSAYQGDIDWAVLTKQNVRFAFIKATEGSSFVDPCFHDNYKNAVKSGIRVGAYHFFSFDSGGDTQAENFIREVEKIDNMLPPVIDLEFYGDKQSNPPDRESVTEQLNVFIAKIEEAYGVKPIIYVVYETYDLYIKDDFSDYDIWIRDVFRTTKLSDNRGWTFWQFTNRARLDGYNGEEKYIDLNVFNGTELEFEDYAKVSSVVESEPTPEYQRYTDIPPPQRFYRDVMLGLVANDNYGEIYPYIGGLLFDGEGREPLFGFVDKHGRIICDPMYESVWLHKDSESGQLYYWANKQTKGYHYGTVTASSVLISTDGKEIKLSDNAREEWKNEDNSLDDGLDYLFRPDDGINYGIEIIEGTGDTWGSFTVKKGDFTRVIKDVGGLVKAVDNDRIIVVTYGPGIYHRWWIEDVAGNIVVPDKWGRYSRNSEYIFSEDGVYDNKGKKVTDAIFDIVQEFKGHYAVTQGNYGGLIDKDFNWIIKVSLFDYIDD